MSSTETEGENGHDYSFDKSPSNSSSSSMEDYMRRLFTACDTDNDGYLDRYVTCLQLVKLIHDKM